METPVAIIPQVITSDRADEVKTLLCRGLDRPTILQYAVKNGWEFAPEQIDEWISAAQLQLAEDAGAIDTEAELGKAIARLTWLYMQASKVQDFKTALAIQKEITKTLELKVKAQGLGHKTNRPEQVKAFRLTIAK